LLYQGFSRVLVFVVKLKLALLLLQRWADPRLPENKASFASAFACIFDFAIHLPQSVLAQIVLVLLAYFLVEFHESTLIEGRKHFVNRDAFRELDFIRSENLLSLFALELECLAFLQSKTFN